MSDITSSQIYEIPEIKKEIWEYVRGPLVQFRLLKQIEKSVVLRTDIYGLVSRESFCYMFGVYWPRGKVVLISRPEVNSFIYHRTLKRLILSTNHGSMTFYERADLQYLPRYGARLRHKQIMKEQEIAHLFFQLGYFEKYHRP